MDEIIARVAEAIKSTPDMVTRSLHARAKASGRTFEDLLAEWSGEEVAAGAAPAPAASAPAAAAPATPAVAATVAAEVIPAEAPPAREAVVDEEEDEEPEEEPEELLVGAGIREAQRSGLPRWLITTFVVVPIVALWYAAAFASGPVCGNAGALAVDPVTGVAANCDGSEFGSLGGNPLKVGSALYTEAAAPACTTCHGAGGEGGAGPAMAGGAVLATFPSCEDHVDWVALGTRGWIAEKGPTYGGPDGALKNAGGFGVMAGYGEALSEEEIRAVVVYERVTFGGLDFAEAVGECIPTSTE